MAIRMTIQTTNGAESIFHLPFQFLAPVRHRTLRCLAEQFLIRLWKCVSHERFGMGNVAPSLILLLFLRQRTQEFALAVALVGSLPSLPFDHFPPLFAIPGAFGVLLAA
jgi:hypothetical protein